MWDTARDKVEAVWLASLWSSASVDCSAARGKEEGISSLLCCVQGGSGYH